MERRDTFRKLEEKYPCLSGDQCIGLSRKQLEKLNEHEKTNIQKRVKSNIPLKRKRRMKSLKEIRIILFGKTGAGKSSTGNLILGKAVFNVSDGAASSLQSMHYGETDYEGRLLRVVDRPGTSDTERSEKEISYEFLKTAAVFHEGIHLFLFVFNLAEPNFTREQFTAFQVVKDMFGKDIVHHSIFIFTHAKQLEINRQSLQDVVENNVADPDIAPFFREINYKFVAVENSSTLYERQLQQVQLVKYFRQVITNASSEVYLPDIFKNVGGAVIENETEHLGDLDPAVRRLIIKSMRVILLRITFPEIKEMTDEHYRQEAKKIYDVVKKRATNISGEQLLAKISSMLKKQILITQMTTMSTKWPKLL